MVKVEAGSGESAAQVFRKFKGKVARSGVLVDVRKKRWFVSKSEQRRLEKKQAVRRNRKKASGKTRPDEK